MQTFPTSQAPDVPPDAEIVTMSSLACSAHSVVLLSIRWRSSDVLGSRLGTHSRLLTHLDDVWSPGDSVVLLVAHLEIETLLGSLTANCEWNQLCLWHSAWC